MSSTVKSSSDSKRSHFPHQSKMPDQYRTQVQQLQELFPSWSVDDLHSVLVEVAGDISLAVTRITEGHAEQWGAVTRKKDKKTSAPQGQTKDSTSTRERGESRGGFRGGRGGRGGPGRGGAAGGRASSARGGHRNHSHTHTGVPASPAANGDTPLSADPWAEATAAPASADTYTGWASTPETQAGTWGSNTESTWGAPSTANGSAAASPAVKSQPIPSARPPVKTPATSKLSWAQIARAPEKPPPTAPSKVSQLAPTPAVPPAPLEPPREPTPPPAPTQEPEPEPTTEAQTGWEEPTTVQNPPWEDEIQAKTSAPAAEHWDTVPVEETNVVDDANPAPPEPVPAPEPVPEPIAVSLPAPQPKEPVSGLHEAIPKHVAPVQPRPSSAAHRHSARFKTDQAVTLPTNFGSGLEKVGMQFGSLSIGGDEIVDTKPEPVAAPAPEPVAKPLSESPAAPEPQQASVPPPPQLEAPVASSSVASSLNSAPSFTPSSQPQAIPQHAQAQTSIPSQPSSSHLPTSISQPALTTPSAAPQVPSQMSGYPHQSQQQQPQPPSQTPQQQQVSPPSHNNNHQQPPHQSLQHQYAQHGLPTHLDPAQTQHQSPLPQQQVPSSFYRQPEAQAPYFHAGAGTPPTSQAQDSPYAAFGQLSQQAPISQLGAFSGGADYGYADSQQRNFYDSYSQQQTGAFGARSGPHDDAKGLPGLQQQQQQQQPQQPQQQQGGPAPPPGGAQQGGQGYPPHMQYYQPYPQNQYYGSPYNFPYTVPQPYVKYPVFPPGPGSAPSPAGPPGKQPQSYGQGQGQGVYGQQHQQAYEEPQLGYHPHAHSHSHQLSASLGGVLPGADYGKPLYAHQHQQGLGTRGAAASQETAFKQYAQGAGAKDVSGVGTGGSGGPQGRGGAPAQAGGFYGASAGRFAQGPGAQTQTGGPAQAQQAQGGPQGHLGYPQATSEGAFYSAYGPAAAQQGRQYWQ